MALDEALIPGRRAEYVAALRRAHAKWLQGNAEARRDPAAYDKICGRSRRTTTTR